MENSIQNALLEEVKLLQELVNQMIENRKSLTVNPILAEDSLSRC